MKTILFLRDVRFYLEASDKQKPRAKSANQSKQERQNAPESLRKNLPHSAQNYGKILHRSATLFV
jgi:hypothetical protein